MPTLQDEGKEIRWARVRFLFERALDLSEAARADFLAQECGEDAALREEIERLISSHHDPESLPYPDLNTDLEPGDVVAGRFEVVERIGSGGMGNVYKVRDRALNTLVALKTIKRELTIFPEIRERFKGEILTGQRVAHKNLCKTHDLVAPGDEDSEPMAFTMELLTGETLAERLERDGRLEPDDALGIARQVVAGLTALRDCDILHRDLKPGNIFLMRAASGEETVKITDFGLSRRIDGAVGATLTRSHSSAIIGTTVYMAPEQLTGDRDKLGPATDVYALGLVLYELLTGERPFSAETIADNLRQKTLERPIAPSRKVRGIDKKWDRTILACLAPDPANRPQDPEAVLEMLEGQRKAPPRPIPWRPIGGLTAAFGILLALSPEIGRLSSWKEPDQLRVAVLPFTVIGGDEQLPPFADGLMETITRGLTQYEAMNDHLLVMAPSTVLSRGVADPQGAFKKLGVNYVIEGDLHASEDSLTLTLTLVDAAAGHQIGTQIVRGSRAETLALRDGAVSRVAGILNLSIQDEYVAELPPVELGAAEFYTTGIGFLQRSNVTANIEKAAEQFQRAIALDKRYALAYAGLCQAQWRLFERTSDTAYLDAAEGNCKTAEILNDQAAETQLANGYVRLGRGQFEQATARFKAALTATPRDSEAVVGLANAFARLGRDDDALATYNQALTLKPADWQIYHHIGRFEFNRREYSRAADAFRKVVDLTPRSAQALLNLGAALQQSGDIEGARELYRRSIAIEPRPFALSNLGKILREEGRYRESLSAYQRAADLKPSSHYVVGDLAAAYEQLRDPRAASTYANAATLALASLKANPKQPTLYSQLAHLHAGAGNDAAAHPWLEQAIARHPIAKPKELVVTAKTLARMGNVDAAFKWLSTAVSRGYAENALKRDYEHSIWLRPIRDDPRFTELFTEYN